MHGQALAAVLRSAVEVLRGEHWGRLRELAVEFVARGAAVATGSDLARATAEAEGALDDGNALERFRSMVEAQGGDHRVIDDPTGTLPAAPVVRPGVVTSMETEGIGLASGGLGAGRTRKGDAIDPAVGIVIRAKIGDRLEAGQPIGEVHARDDDAARHASRRVLDAIVVRDDPTAPPPLVHAWLE